MIQDYEEKAVKGLLALQSNQLDIMGRILQGEFDTEIKVAAHYLIHNDPTIVLETDEVEMALDQAKNSLRFSIDCALVVTKTEETQDELVARRALAFDRLLPEPTGPIRELVEHLGITQDQVFHLQKWKVLNTVSLLKK